MPGKSAFDAALESAGESYVRYVVPAVVGLTTAALVLLSLRRRRAVVMGGASREQLLAEARALRDAYDRHAIGTAAYEGRRRVIRDALVQAEVRDRIAGADREGSTGD
ncbi:MAG: hypothetical protein F4Y96_01175 [Chloroflexi bacterium]|nr:hypothetical protein [Chloroflexota bacterium]